MSGFEGRVEGKVEGGKRVTRRQGPYGRKRNYRGTEGDKRRVERGLASDKLNNSVE